MFDKILLDLPNLKEIVVRLGMPIIEKWFAIFSKN